MWHAIIVSVNTTAHTFYAIHAVKRQQYRTYRTRLLCIEGTRMGELKIPMDRVRRDAWAVFFEATYRQDWKGRVGRAIKK